MDVTDRVINKLFWRLREIYGSKWVMLHKTTEEYNAAKAVWLNKLSHYQDNDINKVLDNIKELYPGNPPDIEQFVKTLKYLKGQRPGHLSNQFYSSEPVEKADITTDFRKAIKEKFGV